MSISTTTNKVIYTGNDTGFVFSINFPYQVDSDLSVKVTDGTTVYILVPGDDFTLLKSSSGGTLTLVDDAQAWISLSGGLRATYKILIKRLPVITQSTDFRNAGRFFAETHEDRFDRQTFFDQQINETVDRGLYFDEFSTTGPGSLPEPVDGKFLRWNGAGGELVNSDFELDDLIVDAIQTANDYSDAGDAAILLSISNVDNTSDLDKPISTATQTALDGKAALVHTHPLSDLEQSGATLNQIIQWNGSAWVPVTGGGGGAPLATNPAETVGIANAVGVGTAAAREDHVHDHGAQTEPTHHAVVTGAANGFMSSTDKTKLDGVATNANNYSHPNHSGDVTSVGDGAQTIENDVVTNAKLANMAANTIKGNNTGVSADPIDLTVAQTRTLLTINNVDNTSDLNKPVSTATQTALNLKANLASPTFTGTVTLPASQVVNGVTLTNAGAATNFLNATGAYSAPAGGGATNLTYDAPTREVRSDTGTDAVLPLMSSGNAGLVPASGGGTTNFLRADGTFAAPPGGGSGLTQAEVLTRLTFRI